MIFPSLGITTVKCKLRAFWSRPLHVPTPVFGFRVAGCQTALRQFLGDPIGEFRTVHLRIDLAFLGQNGANRAERNSAMSMRVVIETLTTDQSRITQSTCVIPPPRDHALNPIAQSWRIARECSDGWRRIVQLRRQPPFDGIDRPGKPRQQIVQHRGQEQRQRSRQQ